MSAGIDAERVRQLLRSQVTDGRVFDLSHPISNDMPVFPAHPAYLLTMYRRHGDPHASERPGRSSFANELIVSGAHVSTHIDALGHFSRDQCVHGGRPAAAIEAREGLRALDVAATPPIFARGVLLDVAAYRGVDCLQAGEAVRGEELDAVARRFGVELRRGDLVLVRTGWSQHWHEPAVFRGNGGLPGADDDGARWLIDAGAWMVGSDTPAFEAIPFPGDSVHAMLLVDHGVQIIENLNLEELSEAGVYTFLFVALPLRIVGATGSPIRPVALT